MYAPRRLAQRAMLTTGALGPRYYEGPQSRIVTIFILEEALGAVALAAVLCTLFSMPGVKRTATWFNVYMSCALRAGP
jgi:hypothetical protein